MAITMFSLYIFVDIAEDCEADHDHVETDIHWDRDVDIHRDRDADIHRDRDADIHRDRVTDQHQQVYTGRLFAKAT